MGKIKSLFKKKHRDESSSSRDDPSSTTQKDKKDNEERYHLRFHTRNISSASTSSSLTLTSFSSRDLSSCRRSLSQHSALSTTATVGALFDRIFYIAPETSAMLWPTSNSTTAGLSQPRLASSTPVCCEICNEPAVLYDGAATDEALRVVMLNGCAHKFHKGCLRSHLRNSSTCPICFKKQQQFDDAPPQLQGRGPSGIMTVREISTNIHGVTPPTPAYEIMYIVPDGTQLEYHQHPGETYYGFDKGEPRYAYLPRNKTGSNLLVRLQYSFMHGLTFVIGYSASLKLNDRVCWSAKVPHKTSLVKGDEFGFPDNNYFQHLSEMLDSIYIPSADDILSKMNVTKDCLLRRLEYNAPPVTVIDSAYQIDRLIVPCSIPRIARGRCPSGTLDGRMIPEQCPGFDAMTLELTYTFEDTVQEEYHKHHGKRVDGTIRLAYLPDNKEGHDLLNRLIIAFRYGLTFDIGFSITQQRDDCIIWSGKVPHITSLSDPSSEFSFPSPKYIGKCNLALSALDIPDGDRCCWLSENYFRSA